MPDTYATAPQTGPVYRVGGVQSIMSQPATGAAPGGYAWDSVQGRWVKTPFSEGEDAANRMRGFGAASGGGVPASLIPAMPADVSFGGGAFGGGSGGSGGGSTPSVAHVAPVDTTASHAAAFATAKDEAAMTAAASLRSLQGSLASRGMGGAGYEAGAIGQTLARDANTVGAASRAEAVDEAGLREREASRNYEGDITQRGQTIGENSSAAQRALEAAIAQYQGGITQRGQNIQLGEFNSGSLRSLFGGGAARY